MYLLNKNLTERAMSIGFFSACVMAVSMPLSRALFNIFALIMVICWLLSFRPKQLINEARSSPALFACLALFGWITLNSINSKAPNYIILDQVSGYTKLLMIPVIVSFIFNQKQIHLFWKSIILGLFILLVSYIADIWIDIPGARFTNTSATGVFNNYIVEGLSLGVFSLITLEAYGLLFKTNRKGAIILLALAAISIYTVLFINPGRGAHLALISGLIVFSFLHLPKRIRVIGVVIVGLTIVTLSFQSAVFFKRFDMAVSEFNTSDTNVQTSVGLRINAWKAGINLWKESPLLGHGTGSYKPLMFDRMSESVGGCKDNPVCEQPHSQYVLFLVEQGIVGFLIFLSVFAGLIWPAFKSSHAAAKLSAVFACAFAVHSAFDSSMRMGTQMFVFVVLTSALIASTRPRYSEQNQVPDN